VDDYDYYDEPRRRSTGKVVGIVLAVVAALSLVGFVAYQVFSPPPPPATVEVPPVVGMSETEARNQIIAAGLRADVAKEESSVDQLGKVIRTEPQVGAQVNERTNVRVVVGSGPASVNVPRLAGMTPQEAEAELQKTGLKLGSTQQQETGDSRLINKVIGSDPQAGESVEGGAQIAIIVGIQQTGVEIPDLAGRDLDDAVNELRQRGLDPQRPDNSDDNDRVSGTNPPAGQRVPPGTEVDLLTGDGDEARLPNVEDLTEEQARDRLNEAGFRRIQVQRQDVSNENQDGIVLQQSPSAGQQVSTDQQITLIVGDAPGGGLVN
jgi:serine/threonine-protein kinase